MEGKSRPFFGTTIADWFLAAFLGTYMGIVAAFGMLYVATKWHGEKKTPEI